jgi:phage-related protein
MAGPIRIAILADAGKANKAIGETEQRVSKLGSGMSKLKAPMLAAGAGIVAVGAGLLGLAKGAAEDEAAQKTLAKTLKNSAGATDAQVSSIEAYISKMGAATGVTDDEMRPALGNLVRATKDVGKAQGLMGLAMDISAGTGKDLGAVSQALAKAQNGSVGGLAKLGIATKDASGKTKSFAQIQKDLAKTFTGQAAAAADTVEGKYKRTKLTLAEIGETVGAKVMPVIGALATLFLTRVIPVLEGQVIPALSKFGAGIAAVAGFVDRNKTGLLVLAGVIGVVAAATAAHSLVLAINSGALKAWVLQTKIVQVATKVWAATQWVLNAALTANPIGLVVIAIVALVAGIVIAYKKSETFRKVVDAAFGAIKKAVSSVVSFFTKLAPSIVRAVGDTSKTLLSKGKNLIFGVINGYNAIIDRVVQFFRGLPGKIAGWIGDTSRSLYGAGKNFIFGVINGYNAVITQVISFFGGLAGKVLGWVGSTVTTLVGAGKNLIYGVINGYNAVIGQVATFFGGIAGKVLGWVGNLGSTLLEAGKAVIQGLIDGIANKVQALKDKLSSITKLIPDIKGPLSRDKRLLTPAGQAILGGLIRGMDDQLPRLRRFLGGVTGTIEGGLSARPAIALAAEPARGGSSTTPQNTGPLILEAHIEIGGEVVRVVRTEMRSANRGLKRTVMAGAV